MWSYSRVPTHFGINVRDHGAKGDGSTDDTTAIQNCINAAAATGIAGASVFLPFGTYIVSATLILKNHVQLVGEGMHATIIKLAAAANVDVIQNYVSSNGTTDPNAEYCAVRNLMIDGNKANQTTAGNGIKYNTNPLTTKASGDDTLYPRQYVENVFILNAYSEGFVSTGRGFSKLHNVHVEGAGTHSFDPGPMTDLSGCTSYNSGTEGFYVAAANVRLSNCKSNTSGQVTAASGHGFHFTSAANGVSLAVCEAQDNLAHGFLFDALNGAVAQGLVADSNSTTSAGTYVGFALAGTTNSEISGVAFERKADGTHSYQTHALALTSTPTGNVINVTHSAIGGATISTVMTSASTPTGNTVSANQQGAKQTFTYAATMAPDPFSGSIVAITLAGSPTINVPPNGPYSPGTTMTMILTQDATGGRAITWGAGFVVRWQPDLAANAVNIIHFVYDGTNWNQINPSPVAGSQNVAYAATIAPDPNVGSTVIVGTLTGAITINVPAAGPYATGTTITYILTQDATGGRVVTWGTGFKEVLTLNTTASKVTAISFVYDGTNWDQVGGTGM